MRYDKEIQRVTDKIRSICNPLQIILFGSATVKDDTSPNDLDFMIVVSDDEYKALVDKIHCEVDRNEIPLDLIVVPQSYYSERKLLEGSLYSVADNEGVLLYERATA